MPFAIVSAANGRRRWSVVGANGHVFAKHTTRRNAERQRRLLYAVEFGGLRPQTRRRNKSQRVKKSRRASGGAATTRNKRKRSLAWLASISDLYKSADHDGDDVDMTVALMAQQLRIPVCDLDERDGAVYYTVLGAWLVPWANVPEQFLSAWNALPTERRAMLLREKDGIYYTQLAPPILRAAIVEDNGPTFALLMRPWGDSGDTDTLRRGTMTMMLRAFSAEYPNPFSFMEHWRQQPPAPPVVRLFEELIAANAVACVQCWFDMYPQYFAPGSGGVLGAARLCGLASAQGHLPILTALRVLGGCPWDKNTPMGAAQFGHMQCLAYAHENGCPWDESTPIGAAEGGHLDCLQYAHENGCVWDEGTPMGAAEGGHLDCLQYAHENGCPWDVNTPRFAAEHGYLHCIQYAHENGCPWDEGTPMGAAEGGHLHCLQYAHENGCPWDETTPTVAAGNGHLKCVVYAVQRGCPWDAQETLENAESSAREEDADLLEWIRQRAEEEEED